MNAHTAALNITLAFTGAQDFALTITLVVFVILTALLAAFIIMLFAWKRFRDFFFADKDKAEKQPRKKSVKPTAKTDAKQKPDRAQSRVSAPTNKAAKAHTTSEYHIDDCCDGVPTVPLDGTTEIAPSSAAPKKSTRRTDATLDKIPTVVIGTPQTTDRPVVHTAKAQSGGKTAVDKTAPTKKQATGADKTAPDKKQPAKQAANKLTSKPTSKNGK